MRTNENIKPLPVWESVVIMLIITLLPIISFYLIRPFLENAGLNKYMAYFLSLSVCFIIMIIWSIIVFLSEGHQRTIKAFLKRVRLNSMNLNIIIWSIGLGLIMFLSTIIFSPLISKAISNGFIKIPEGIPDYLNPVKQQSISQLKMQLTSNGVLPVIPIVLLLNIIGEELFWRGIIFPRQELRHGSGTFLIHGSMWAFTHLFQYWLLPPIFIGSVALSYIVQRTKNTWTSILAHTLNNTLPVIIILLIR